VTAVKFDTVIMTGQSDNCKKFQLKPFQKVL